MPSLPPATKDFSLSWVALNSFSELPGQSEMLWAMEAVFLGSADSAETMSTQSSAERW